MKNRVSALRGVVHAIATSSLPEESGFFYLSECPLCLEQPAGGPLGDLPLIKIHIGMKNEKLKNMNKGRTRKEAYDRGIGLVPRISTWTSFRHR
jgi:hypothetical protein